MIPAAEPTALLAEIRTLLEAAPDRTPVPGPAAENIDAVYRLYEEVLDG